MRLSLLAVAALPILAGGIAITTAVAVLGTADAPAPAPAPSPAPMLGKSVSDRAARADTDTNTGAGTGTGTEPVVEPGDGPGTGNRAVGGAESADRSGSGDDTEIDGRRPHLTVIDGHSEVALPGSVIHAVASVLPPPPRELPALADPGGDLVWTDEPGPRGVPDGRSDGSVLAEDPDSVPPRKPGAAPPLGGVPEPGSPTDDSAAGEDGSGARPPAAGRPGRPAPGLGPTDTRGPSDPVERPGAEDSVGWPTLTAPEPLPPDTELLSLGVDPLVPAAVDPGATDTVGGETMRGDTVGGDPAGGDPAGYEGTTPDEASRPTAESDLDDSRPPSR